MQQLCGQKKSQKNNFKNFLYFFSLFMTYKPVDCWLLQLKIRENQKITWGSEG